jgi:hypothetical protein
MKMTGTDMEELLTLFLQREQETAQLQQSLDLVTAALSEAQSELARRGAYIAELEESITELDDELQLQQQQNVDLKSLHSEECQAIERRHAQERLALVDTHNTATTQLHTLNEQLKDDLRKQQEALDLFENVVNDQESELLDLKHRLQQWVAMATATAPSAALTLDTTTITTPSQPVDDIVIDKPGTVKEQDDDDAARSPVVRIVRDLSRPVVREKEKEKAFVAPQTSNKQINSNHCDSLSGRESLPLPVKRAANNNNTTNNNNINSVNINSSSRKAVAWKDQRKHEDLFRPVVRNDALELVDVNSSGDFDDHDDEDYYHNRKSRNGDFSALFPPPPPPPPAAAAPQRPPLPPQLLLSRTRK